MGQKGEGDEGPFFREKIGQFLDKNSHNFLVFFSFSNINWHFFYILGIFVPRKIWPGGDRWGKMDLFSQGGVAVNNILSERRWDFELQGGGILPFPHLADLCLAPNNLSCARLLVDYHNALR